MNLDIFSNNLSLPVAANDDNVKLRMEQFWAAVNKRSDSTKDFFDRFCKNTKGRELLVSVFGNSQYLSNIIIKELEYFQSICQNGFEQSFATLMQQLPVDASKIDNKDALISLLRITKQRAALLIALADISDEWKLEEVTGKLSIFADLNVRIAINFLLTKAALGGELDILDIKNPEESSGLVVIAMGKLGAYELNYSSDIDLIIFYDEKRANYIGKKTLGYFYVKFAKELTEIMQQRTKDGYVFRTDLRLRPDPGSNPMAIPLKAAEIYYETVGQNWERAAMIKARPIAGDKTSCNKFMDFIEPYIWRKYLDFASIDDIHSIKRQIQSKHSLPENLYGYNVKLGPGGIREVEFFIQTQQLIWGGQRPILRESSTRKSLEALLETKEIDEKTCNDLLEAYNYYRKIEHRLQMLADQQTHTLPSNKEEMNEFAIFMGYSNDKEFIDELSQVVAMVQDYYASLFQNSPSLASDSGEAAGNLVFTGVENDPETLETLEKMGFSETISISETIRGWHHGRYRSTQTKRSREMLTELMPILLDSLANTINPDIAFTKFDDFLKKLPAGVQIFSLLYANPHLLELIAEIMGGYPLISDSLSRSPNLLDYVLAPEFFDMLPEIDELKERLENELKKAKDMQDTLEIVRRWTHGRQFRIGIQLIKDKINTQDAIVGLSNIADVVISVLLGEVTKEFEKQHGKIKDSDFSIVAFGKLGSRELTFSSDLDLVFIYRTDDKNASSDGNTLLPASQYFVRLSRRFINAVTALTKEGTLYEIDLRLRPSGGDGPIATSLEGFDTYYGSSAWTWEYMALTKARVIVGTKEFQEEIREVIKAKLQKQWTENELKDGIINMHNRLKEEHTSNNPFDVKHSNGGIVDLEYILQYLQLKYASEHPDILESNTKQAIQKAKDIAKINKKNFDNLMEAADFFANLQSILRLTNSEGMKESDMKEGLKNVILRNIKIDNWDELKENLNNMQKNVEKLFNSIILGN